MTIRSMIFGVAALAALTASPASAFDDAAADASLKGAIANYIRPAMTGFHTATGTLATRIDGLCATPSPQSLASAQGAFAATVLAFARVDLVRIGPLTEDNRLERINHIPDRKGIGRKQIEAILRSGDESVTKAAALKDKSVAIQGLPALEIVLFDPPESLATAKPQSPACRYAAAIAGNLAQMAGELDDTWAAPDGAAAALSDPGKGASPYRDHKEAITALLGIAVHGAEALRETGLESFYRGEKEKPKPKAAPFRLSGQTMPAYVAGMTGLVDFWTAAEMRSLPDENSRSVSDSAMFDAKAITRAAAKLANPDETNLADPAYRKRLDYLLLTSKDLILRLGNDYGKAIGLAAGFSFSDGD